MQKINDKIINCLMTARYIIKKCIFVTNQDKDKLKQKQIKHFYFYE